MRTLDQETRCIGYCQRCTCSGPCACNCCCYHEPVITWLTRSGWDCLVMGRELYARRADGRALVSVEQREDGYDTGFMQSIGWTKVRGWQSL